MNAQQAWCHLLPAEKCYWAVLKRKDLGTKPDAIRYHFESMLPVPVEDVLVEVVPLADQTIVACGVERVLLEDVLGATAAQNQRPWRIAPDAVPVCVHECGIELDEERLLAALNFCRGEFVHPMERHWKRVTYALLALACVCLIALGEWRIWQAVSSYAQQNQEVCATYQDVLTAAVPQPQDGLDAWTTLELSMRRLTLLAEQAGSENDADCRAVAQQFLQHVPAVGRVQIQSVSYAQDRVSVRGTAAELSEAQALWAGCQLMEKEQQWSLRPLQAQTQSDGTTLFQILLQRKGAQP